MTGYKLIIRAAQSKMDIQVRLRMIRWENYPNRRVRGWMVAPERCVHTPETVTVTFFIKIVLAYVVKDLEMRSSQITGGPKSNDKHLCKWHTVERDAGREVTMWRWRQRLELDNRKPRNPWSYQKREEGQERPTHGAFRGNMALLTPWFQTPQL